jgi:hypothetical protein
MYSKINVDVSCKDNEFETVRLSTSDGFKQVGYKVLPIIRGSSTVNGDSAHSPTLLAREHNYVTFNVKKIKLSCTFYTNNNSVAVFRSCYVVLFKVPYISEDKLPTLINDGAVTGSMDNFILYKSPENVLNYGCFNMFSKKNGPQYTLYCNKSITVGPNDYLGVCYLLGSNSGNIVLNVDASAEVIFKPI